MIWDESDIMMCYDEDGCFDWETYQYLCDISEYWDNE